MLQLQPRPAPAGTSTRTPSTKQIQKGPLPQPPRVIVSSKKKKNVKPVLFCRPGIEQLDRKTLTKNVEAWMGSLTLDDKDSWERFEDMGLDVQILKGIHGYGLEKPGEIQQKAIVPIITGKDAIVQAQSGMGKTATLVISVLQRLDKTNRNCQALILVPTRELAEQMEKVVLELCKYMTPTISCFTCIGGRSIGQCRTSLTQGRQIVIGTLGRTIHMLLGDGPGRGPYLKTESIKILALDEADQMLSGGCGKELTRVLELIPGNAQVILMSATMPPSILKHARKFMRDPVALLLRNYQLTLQGILQYCVSVGDENDKLSTLIDLYDAISKARGMVFCNSRPKVNAVQRLFFEQTGKRMAFINGDMSQGERDDIMRKFRKGEEGYRVIITSDLLGRGIDVQQINLVINYDIPHEKEQYIHRVGRAGRYGRKGIAVSFVKDNEAKYFKELKAFYGTQINPMPPVNDFERLLLQSRS